MSLLKYMLQIFLYYFKSPTLILNCLLTGIIVTISFPVKKKGTPKSKLSQPITNIININLNT